MFCFFPITYKIVKLTFYYLHSPEACISGGSYWGAGGAGIAVEEYGSFGTGGYYYSFNQIHDPKPGVVLLEFS